VPSVPVTAQPVHPQPAFTQPPPRPQVVESPRVTAAPAPSYEAPQPQQLQALQPYEAREPERRPAPPIRVENNPPPSIQAHPQIVVPEERFAPPPRVEQPRFEQAQRQGVPQPAAPVNVPQQHPIQTVKSVTREVKPEEKDKR
ncbi:MAG TPA: hypothetical protein VNW52_07425, partial [Burkholderiaceae bacterium]|nr:hypothetical protein [Burkholderiaceae bacterium]